MDLVYENSNSVLFNYLVPIVAISYSVYDYKYTYHVWMPVRSSLVKYWVLQYIGDNSVLESLN